MICFCVFLGFQTLTMHLIYSIYIVELLCIAYCPQLGKGQHNEKTRVLLRQNYGVVMENIGMLDTVQSMWHQSFVVNLNMTELPIYDHPCDNNINRSKRSSNRPYTLTRESEPLFLYSENQSSENITFDNFCPGLLAYKFRHEEMLNSIKQTRRNIDHLLPEPSRVKRGLFDFMGKISKSLFGTATSDDINILKRKINHINSQH